MKIGGGRSLALPIALVFFFIPAMAALAVGIASSLGGNAGPNPKGAEINRPVDPTDPEVQRLMGILKGYADPSQVLRQTQTLDPLRDSLNDLINGINGKDPAYTKIPQPDKVIALAQSMVASIGTIQLNPTSKEAKTAATKLIEDANALQAVLTITGANLPADKGVCPFCTAKWIPEDTPNVNHNYGMPKAIILHYLSTVSGSSRLLSPDGAYNYFRNAVLGSADRIVYVQFVVGRDGTIYQFMHETKQVAGALNYNAITGKDGQDGISISVENEGQFEDGDGGHSYTKEQVASNVKLVKYLMSKYNIPTTEVISHEIADCRTILLGKSQQFHRTDPGESFMHAVLSQIGADNSAEERSCTQLEQKVGFGAP